ncbi:MULTISPECIES: Holliday junction resolvase RuvX [unclassified Roseofilum]|uniref:Holliday junction resolvase RuvX n=1 Tax=unclassified Roseofilum TaxID=2620099 RepID=UPI000E975FD2|nr:MULTISPECIES: Holliday junction resolvase RuvX [unclassified Roseofilum]MBP0007259.1 Holliday junction resolvase RuvX [Roseofilum sp. Belize Diploria]MBP0031653.1 Holliday junction resolvase RuvX [Roseofilum sp. Belize BBD 4]HBR00639.1 Holliday junction resolvase RuvX [Cyanobacteria bacterium UBA11691]
MISALGLDIGQKRIGVAGCDLLGLLATPLTTIYRESFETDVALLKPIIIEREVSILIIGLPYLMDGQLGTQAQQVQKYSDRLQQALQLPVEYVDERCTSLEAKEILVSRKRSPSHNKGLIDAQAAALILQRWLDDRA